MLTLERKHVGRLLADGDTRWIHRAAYDLMDYRPHAHESLSKMPRGVSLYGSLPAQLQDSSSFARRLAEILAVRKRYGIATSVQLDVPQPSNKAMLVMVHQLADAEQVTVLNFSAHAISGSVRSEQLVPGSALVDMFTDQEVGEVDDLHTFSISLEPHGASRSWCCVRAIIWPKPTRRRPTGPAYEARWLNNCLRSILKFPTIADFSGSDTATYGLNSDR